ncbi:MAG TPA: 3'-5' exonuclease [Candidatus Acidoferrales bacterium]|nr:3'-5' exonuclease [Candidatus Acidoferrales bacterium]
MTMFDGVAVVDVEATGLDSRKCSIVSVGVVLYTAGKVKEYYYECKPFKGAVINDEALEINGATRKELRSPKRLLQKKMMTDIYKVLKSHGVHTIAGQNTSFDRDFLDSAARRCKVRWDFGHRTIDMHSIAYAIMLRKKMRIPTKEGHRNHLTADVIYTYLGMPEEPRPHNGLTGARMEFEGLARMVYGKSLLDEFKGYKVTGYHM